MSNLITTQINELAVRFNLPESEELYNVLKATAFKGEVSDAQLSALLIVANQYGLNPWTKEIYAFPDKGNGIVPVVGVDGWARIINSNKQFDGMDFEQDADSCTCVIYRKDRGHPIKVTEWMAECKRSNAGPWQSHPYRMLRHKAMIQCARIAFGFGGIYDADEAERIVESIQPAKVIDPATGEIKTAATLPA
jgi:phage recombination protein Bet